MEMENKNKEKFELIKRNTAEIISDEELQSLLALNQHPKVYIGRAITGPVHIGHLASLTKLLDFQKAEFQTIILLADIHAALDDLKSEWEELDLRYKYTKKAIELCMDWPELPKMIRGSDFQTEHNYIMDLFKFSSQLTVNKAMHAASEVTRMKNPKVSELIYPIMQSLDEQYLDVDVQLGGSDQRHIQVLAREYLPIMGYKKRIEVMMTLIPSLKGPGVKMSSSVEGSMIKVNASEEEIRKLIKDAYCPNQIITDNPIIEIMALYVLPNEGSIIIERDNKFGGDLKIESARQLKAIYTEGKLHPLDLKNYLAEYLIKKMKRVRDYFESNKDLLKQLGPKFE
ncbi:MAG: tyrosine--tRNA ligase [Candidatus Marsarchaeota archaeon]|nr:tyrosine--tRNA ligase [Candidatus Marsarchaeota archaeon]